MKTSELRVDWVIHAQDAIVSVNEEMQAKNRAINYPSHIKREYYEYCRKCMNPADVLEIQSTAVIHLKYTQYYLMLQERNSRMSKFSNLLSLHGSNEEPEYQPQFPLMMQFYTPFPVSLALLSDPIELMRSFHTIPQEFWKHTDRLHIPSRPRMAPPPVRIINREISGVERKILLTRLCKQAFVREDTPQYSEDLVKLVLGKFIARKQQITRKRVIDLLLSSSSPSSSTSATTVNRRNSHIPKQSSPLTKVAFVNSSLSPAQTTEETTFVNRKDSKMDQVDVETQRKGSWIKTRSSKSLVANGGDQKEGGLWKSLSSAFSRLLT